MTMYFRVGRFAPVIERKSLTSPKNTQQISLDMHLKPIFTKTLSQTDVECRMTIPMSSFGIFQIPEGEHSKQFVFIDIITDVLWKFQCSTRKKIPIPNQSSVQVGLSMCKTRV
ncbi:unnamed protein product [Dovyalis caffra]|uniref:Uncharacterized protein n=1 Tax=Dovyalis caffra TaxID=77055 RepID=A0AAV1SVL1_9ROSI|nr:unnamed protein product [Dovyalis caffra]